MLRSIFVDRALRYEPEARVYTSSPTTIKALFKQRRRWNSSRIEVTGRFWRALWFHWSLGLPALGIMFLIAKYCLLGGFMYLRLPLAFGRPMVLTAFVLGYGCQFAGYSMLTLFALVLNGEWRHWRLALALPLSPLYAICFTYGPSLVGASHDVLFFGNVTGFAPETTLIRGGSTRIALAYRLRRAFLLAVRSLIRGDVPLGRFWFGWGENSVDALRLRRVDDAPPAASDPDGRQAWLTRSWRRWRCSRCAPLSRRPCVPSRRSAPTISW